MANSRKYILNINNKISCGLGSQISIGQTHSLLNSFAFDGTTFQQLTVDELSMLDNVDYDNRVLNFLDYIDIESENDKEILFSGATMNDPNCLPLYCKLNPDFKVYKFLNGVRIINVGESNPNCRLEYKAYPLNSDETDYPWQSSPTFNELDVNGVYVFKIRDYSPGYDAIVCEYEKTISLALLLPSTTTTKGNRMVRLDERYSNTTSIASFKTGIFKISPNLSGGEKTKIDYLMNVSHINNGLGEVELLYDQGNGNYDQYRYFTSRDTAPPSGSFTLCQGQSMCYNITANATEGGSSAIAGIKINSVDGGSTNNSYIDLNSCASSVNFINKQIPVYISLSANTVTSTNNSKTGIFIISPPISVSTDIINITVSAVTSIASQTGSASIKFYKFDTSIQLYRLFSSFASTSTQPQKDIVIPAVYNGKYCYNITANANNGVHFGCIKLKSVSSSSTSISPLINSPNIDSLTVASSNKTPVGVYVNSNNHILEMNVGNASTYRADLGGSIIVDKTALLSVVGSDIYKKVNICYSAYTCSRSLSNLSLVEICCKGSSASAFNKISCHSNIASDGFVPSIPNLTFGCNNKWVSGSFVMDYDDTIRYSLINSSWSTTCLVIKCVTDNNTYDGRISPFICNNAGILLNNDYLTTLSGLEPVPMEQ